MANPHPAIFYSCLSYAAHPTYMVVIGGSAYNKKKNPGSKFGIQFHPKINQFQGRPVSTSH